MHHSDAKTSAMTTTRERPRLLLMSEKRGCAALALKHPSLLEELLHQCLELGEMRRTLRAMGDEVRQSRQQVSRLVSMLWEAMPVEGRGQWFSQRHMMERLQEEVARAQRHGGP